MVDDHKEGCRNVLGNYMKVNEQSVQGLHYIPTEAIFELPAFYSFIESVAMTNGIR